MDKHQSKRRACRRISWQAAITLAAMTAGAACTAEVDGTELRSRLRTGELGLNLEVPPGQSLDRVAYRISRPDGFSMEGAMMGTGFRRNFSAALQLPAARDYTIVLEAITMARRCIGMAQFAIDALESTPVRVVLRCPGTGGTTGTLQVDGTFNVCPVADAIEASAEEAVVGNSVALQAAAWDEDARPSPLAYRWSAASGTFSHANAVSTLFSCTTASPATVTLTVSDGDSGCSLARASIRIACNDSAVDLPGQAGAGREAGTGSAGEGRAGGGGSVEEPPIVTPTAGASGGPSPDAGSLEDAAVGLDAALPDASADDEDAGAPE